MLADDCDPAIQFAATQQPSLWLNRRLMLLRGTADLHDTISLPATVNSFFMLQMRDVERAVDSVDQAMRRLNTKSMFQLWSADGNTLFKASPPALVIADELHLDVDFDGALSPSLSGRPVTYSTFALATQCANVPTGVALVDELRGLTHVVNALGFVAG